MCSVLKYKNQAGKFLQSQINDMCELCDRRYIYFWTQDEGKYMKKRNCNAYYRQH